MNRCYRNDADARSIIWPIRWARASTVIQFISGTPTMDVMSSWLQQQNKLSVGFSSILYGERYISTFYEPLIGGASDLSSTEDTMRWCVLRLIWICIDLMCLTKPLWTVFNNDLANRRYFLPYLKVTPFKRLVLLGIQVCHHVVILLWGYYKVRYTCESNRKLIPTCGNARYMVINSAYTLHAIQHTKKKVIS